MPQQTNLNVAPYFDDFDPSRDYYKVLFKPGYPVQARELTTLQSILQNQIEKFGQHFFKEGAKVIPGNIAYSQIYYCVQLNNTFEGVPVSAYANQLVGTKITGQTSGVSAFVNEILLPIDSERGNLTLYVSYLNSSTFNNSTEVFFDGESLTCDSTIISSLLGNATIAAGSPFAVTLSLNAAATGSSFFVNDGVYFVRGNFVDVQSETLILDQYSNLPNYRVGFLISEEIINDTIDESLSDNSQGFNNYSAPGADRLKISVSLTKKSLTDLNDNNFIELATIVNGVIKSKVDRGDLGGGPGYLDIRDTLARRTYAESGDYCVKDFDVNILNSLNDNIGNGGVFQPGQFTYGGAIASNNLALYKISPGRAFVRGYDLELLTPTFIDVEKPRTTKTIEDREIIYNTGPSLKVNRVYGVPVLGIGNTYVLSLRDSRRGVGIATVGNEIGLARVYDFRLESGSYDATNSNLNQWALSLFDVQTFTDITLNQATSLSIPTRIEGSNSGATGFIRHAVSAGVAVTVYDTSGEFIANESLIFNGIADGRIAIAVTTHSLSDVKSVHGTNNGIVGLGSTFLGDIVQSIGFNVGIATISAASGGVSTVFSTNTLFPGTIVKRNNLVQFSNTANRDISFAKVVSIGRTSITIEAVTSVAGIASGDLPTTTLNATDFKILTTKLDSSSDKTLYTKLPKKNISSVDLTGAILSIRKTFTVNISSNQLSAAVTAGTDETFLPFDEERYTLTRSDGETETLTSDRLEFLAGSTQLQIRNLGSNNTGATLTATLRKVNPKAKEKIKNRVNSLIIDKSKYAGSGIGTTTLNDGLTFGNYPFGTRVQDKILSLNVPDIIQIHGIFESADTSNPSAPKIIFSSLTSSSTTTTELIIGETLTGQTSGAVAICAEKLTSSQIAFIYKNDNRFKEGETVLFSESRANGIIVTLDSDSFEISSNYKLDNGQEETIYNYGTLIRKNDSEEPSKKLKVYFSNGYFESTDDGDITTVNSYSRFDYSRDLQSVNDNRVSDIIDIRPRVSSFTVSENSRSPLEFLGRTFNSSGNSATNILASDESILTTFSYYLGRIDRIFLTKEGVFQVKYGQPSERPEKAVSVDEALEIATITLPPYLYTPEAAVIQFLEHKRYRMVDIKQLENRIRNLEFYTTLSLLETNTSNLFVPDADGLNRFKSGFFVDNFSSFRTQEENTGIKNSIDVQNKELRPKHYTNSVNLIFGPVTNIDPTQDLRFNIVEGVNIRRADNVVTLDYAEVKYLEQPFGTRSESVTPFLLNFWRGTIVLTPSSDTWVDTTRLASKIIEIEGNYASTLLRLEKTQNVDSQTGFAPIVWNSWQDNWTGRNNVESARVVTVNTDTAIQVVQENLRETIETGVATRTGSRTVVSEQFDRTSVGDRVVSREIISFMRSRNIQFVSKLVKPLTRLYAFFDGKDVTRYCVPKLLEISMNSGVFQVGEKISGTVRARGLGPDLSNTSPRITFRVAQSNHKEGPYNLPTVTFVNNPYTNQPLSGTYSSTSNILNVDTFSLASQSQGEFSGYVETGMDLIGETSGARATITSVRLVSDLSATLIGSFFIPNPNGLNHPKFETGTKIFTIINDENNNKDFATTTAQEAFSASGTQETVQEDIISVRNSRVEIKETSENKNISRSLGTQVVGSTILSEIAIPRPSGSSDGGGSGPGSGGGGNDFIQPPPPPTPEIINLGTLYANLGKRRIGEYADQQLSQVLALAGFPQSVIDSVKPNMKPAKFDALAKEAVESLNAQGVYSLTVETTPTNRLADPKGDGSRFTQKEARALNAPVSAAIVAATPADSRVAAAAARAPAARASSSGPSKCVGGKKDPLAQSFFVADASGVFVTKCDIFFETKDNMDIPFDFQIRTMENGFPTQRILPFSEIVLNPDQILTSIDGSIATTIEFDAPVYLEGGKEYAMCLLSYSTQYRVFISRVTENDLINQTFVSTQPFLGSLFKSQNASTWEPSQWEDLKFTLYRADFLSSGSVEFYNPELTEGNGQVATLQPDSLVLNSKKVRVGLGITISDSGYVLGNTFSQLGTNATGDLVGVAGSATGTLTVSNAGIGYTPSSGGQTFSGVNLITVTGSGRGATANITISNGVAVAATISGGGSGYQVGDVLGITTIGAASVGKNARLTIAGIGLTNELILDNVQGNFVTGAGFTMSYINSSGITTTLNFSQGGNVTPTEIVVVNDGLHIKINHQNHGMYFSDNRVKIQGALSDVKPTKLTAEYDASSTGSIAVTDSTAFSTFENVGVGTTNIGYLLIGNEIIEYTSVSGNNIAGNIIRGLNPLTYPVGTPVYKYELGGVNLKRINTTHNLNDVTISNPITFDSYHIKLDMTALDIDNDDRSNDVGYPALHLNRTKSAGGYNIKATQNMPFEIITPVVHNVTVRGTNLTGEIRTITSKSISGNEIPYAINEFEAIAINEPNYLDSPRMIASKVNEDAKLTNFTAGAKSLNMKLLMTTVDSRVSPVIDAERVSVILTSNRVNQVITNYATDGRVNKIDTDPTACQYVSKEITLENSASSIKILVAAHINLTSDLRAFYAIGNAPGFNPIFIPFPGYSNLNTRGQVIAQENNNGESDVFVPKTNTYGFSSDEIQFKEYVFTADQLPAFRSYRIKLLLTSTSQVYVPRIKDLRVISLA